MWIVDHHCLEVIVCFVDIGGIVDHHCLEMIVRFVDIDGIAEHHCLEVFACFVDIGWIIDHHCLEVILCFVDIGVNCWPSLFRGDCSLCWHWCEFLTITDYRSLFTLLILVSIVEHHYLEVIALFVDIDVNCWPALAGGDCLFCWYSWKSWPSLFRGGCLLCWYWCELLTITA